MVDVQPWGGDYSGTVVQDNFIVGGLADGPIDGVSARTGSNADGVILKYALDQLRLSFTYLIMRH